LWFKRRLKGRTLYWNWHNVFGVWSLVPLAVIVLSATVISYPWASNFVYRLSGVEPPVQAGRRTEQQDGRRVSPGADLKIVQSAIDRIQREVPDWKAMTIRIPARQESTISLTVDRGSSGQPQYRSTITVDTRSGEVSKVEKFQDQNRGRRLRSWLRFVHTGEYYGVAGQSVAGVASLAGVILVGTGFALSVYRAMGWVRRRVRLLDSVPRIWASEKLFEVADSSYYGSQTNRSSEES